MSQAPNANFFIVNKTAASDGKLLAATYTGQGDAVIVTEFANLDSQVVRLSSLISKSVIEILNPDYRVQWVLGSYDATSQTISPKNASSLLAGTQGSNYTLKALSSGIHNWILQGAVGTYTLAFPPRCLSFVH